jgi:hypothetical protein
LELAGTRTALDWSIFEAVDLESRADDQNSAQPSIFSLRGVYARCSFDGNLILTLHSKAYEDVCRIDLQTLIYRE